MSSINVVDLDWLLEDGREPDLYIRIRGQEYALRRVDVFGELLQVLHVAEKMQAAASENGEFDLATAAERLVEMRNLLKKQIWCLCPTLPEELLEKDFESVADLARLLAGLLKTIQDNAGEALKKNLGGENVG